MLGLALGALGLAAAAAPAPLTPYEAQFKVRQGILSGRLTQRLEPSDEGLKGQSVAEAAGIIGVFVGGDLTEESWMSTAGGTLRPLRFRSRDNISNDRHDIDASVQWGAGEVLVRMDERDLVLEFEGEVQDRVSLQFYLMAALGRGERPEHVQMIHEDEIRQLEISYLPERSMKTPAGEFRVFGVRHQKPGSTRITTFWSAPELGYLPVAIEQEKRGKRKWRAVLQEHRYLERPSPPGDASTGN